MIPFIVAKYANAMIELRLRIKISLTYLLTITTSVFQIHFADLSLVLQFCMESLSHWLPTPNAETKVLAFAVMAVTLLGYFSLDSAPGRVPTRSQNSTIPANNTNSTLGSWIWHRLELVISDCLNIRIYQNVCMYVCMT